MDDDTGGKFTREETAAYYNMPSKYYSFDQQGFHFVILDGNEKRNPPQRGYPRYIGSEQMEWLRDDLNTTNLPTLVFSHQSLTNSDGVENSDEVKEILEEANKKSKYMKVVACICGHHHKDYIEEISGIQYININSMSYKWLGGDYLNIRYSEEIDILEYISSQSTIYQTLHWYTNDEHFSSSENFQLDNPDEYHVFGLEWTPEELIFYVDGEITRRLFKS